MEMTSINIFSKKRCVALALAAATLVPAAAQLHEEISVEGKYVPEIIRVERVNTFPKALAFTLDSSPLAYEKTGVAASFAPGFFPMEATGWRDTRRVMSNPGYLEFGAGSWLNSTLSAGYRLIDNTSTLAGVRLQHNSTSLWKPKVNPETKDVTQYRYDEALGIYASHIVKGYGRIDAALDYHLGLFNYYGNTMCRGASFTEKGSYKAPTQTLNDVAFKADWKSLLSPHASLDYYASLRIRHLAFRALHLPAYWGGSTVKGNRETDTELKGGVKMPWGDNGSSIGLDADLNILTYGGPKNVFVHAFEGEIETSLFRPENYAMLSLTPYYRFTRGLLDIKLGADLDLAFNAGPEGNRYSFLHVAPEVKFALQKGPVGLYLNATGGSELNTLANLRQHDYYMMPALTTTRPTFTPIDGAFGVNLGPFSGFSLGLEARYKVSRNVRLGGWYQAWLNNGLRVSGIADNNNYGDGPLGSVGTTDYYISYLNAEYCLDAEGINLHGASFSGYVTCNPASFLSLRADASYQPQKGEKGFFNGYDRPKVTANVELAVKPISPLTLTMGYAYRGKRAIYTRYVYDPASGGVIINGERQQLFSHSLPDLTLLNMSASYEFTPRFSVWMQADNLLNRHDEVLPDLPSQGVVIVAGLKWLF